MTSHKTQICVRRNEKTETAAEANQTLNLIRQTILGTNTGEEGEEEEEDNGEEGDNGEGRTDRSNKVAFNVPTRLLVSTPVGLS